MNATLGLIARYGSPSKIRPVEISLFAGNVGDAAEQRWQQAIRAIAKKGFFSYPL